MKDGPSFVEFILMIVLLLMVAVAYRFSAMLDRVKELESQVATLQQMSQQLSTTEQLLRETMRKHNY